MLGDRLFKAGIVEAVKLQASVNMAKVHLYQYEHRGEKSYSELYNDDKRDIGEHLEKFNPQIGISRYPK